MFECALKIFPAGFWYRDTNFCLCAVQNGCGIEISGLPRRVDYAGGNGNCVVTKAYVLRCGVLVSGTILNSGSLVVKPTGQTVR